DVHVLAAGSVWPIDATEIDLDSPLEERAGHVREVHDEIAFCHPLTPRMPAPWVAWRVWRCRARSTAQPCSVSRTPQSSVSRPATDRRWTRKSGSFPLL